MRRSLAALLVASLAAACGEPVPVDRGGVEPDAGAPTGATPFAGPVSPSARAEVVASLRNDEMAVRSPADGGGRARLEPLEGAPAPVTAGGFGAWRVIYEVGPEGIAEGGAVYLQPSPFWGWSPPQVASPDAPGFTRASTEAAGVSLRPEAVAEGLLAVHVEGAALRPGDVVTVTYGAGPQGARGDRYAERASPLWIAVDGDGDGVRALLPPMGIDVAAGPAALLWVTLPSTAAVGDRVRLAIAALDPLGNRAESWVGTVTIEAPDGLGLPAEMVVGPEDRGAAIVEGEVRAEGTWRVRAVAGELAGESNPLVVGDGGARILWGDLHGHSQLSDGTGTPEEWFAYAREVAALDVVSLTDHDHWGLRPLAKTPEAWDRIRGAAASFHEPGRFVTLLGYEWTNWMHGHRHVLYFEDEGRVYDAIDPAFDDPRELWDALRGQPALTIAHHSAGGPVATNWAIPPDPELEPITEVVSVHGASEAMDAPRPIYAPVPGNFVRDALGHGYRLGFVGSGDGHDGHPGLAHLGAPTGGLAAILADEATRPAILEALKARRVYATSGPRIVLRASLDGHRMGEEIAPAALRDPARLVVQATGVAELERIDLVRGAEVVASQPATGRQGSWAWKIPGLEPGELLYVRVVQSDGHAAWSSPFFVGK